MSIEGNQIKKHSFNSLEDTSVEELAPSNGGSLISEIKNNGKSVEEYDLDTDSKMDNFIKGFLKKNNTLVKALMNDRTLNIEDVHQMALEKLLEAKNKYNPNRGATLSTFAWSFVKNRLIDEIRKVNPLSRDFQDRSKEIDTAQDFLTQKLKREPTLDEIADEMKIPIGKLQKWLDEINKGKINRKPHFSFSEEIHNHFHDSLTREEIIPNDDINPLEQLIEKEKKSIEEIVKMLPNENLQKAVLYYFKYDFTMKEIGNLLDVSEGRIYQYIKTAKEILKKNLQKEL